MSKYERIFALTMLSCAVAFGSGQAALAGSTNGSAGLMPALYDGQRFMINF